MKLCTRRAQRAESQARRTRQPSVHFSFDIKQLTTTNHAQKAWIILLKSCRHIAAHRHGPGLTCTVRYPCTHAGAAAYPPATGAGSAERLGICTEGVDETVHRLFDERSEPMLARPAGDRLKIEQNQGDGFVLCTNAVETAVHWLWKLGARPEPVGLRRRCTLFAHDPGRSERVAITRRARPARAALKRWPTGELSRGYATPGLPPSRE